MKRMKFPLIALIYAFILSCGGAEQPAENAEEGEAASEEMQSKEMHDHEAMANDVNSEMKEAPANARVFFENLKEGATVTSPFKVKMGVEGMTVHPAGELVEGTGHHHVIIGEPGVPMGVVVPADEHHIHFGGGQTETELKLDPGVYMITLQFADGLHRSYGDQMSATINVEVNPGK